jgi:hypothetical protein
VRIHLHHYIVHDSPKYVLGPIPAVTRYSYGRRFREPSVASCLGLSSEEYVAPEQLLSESVRRKALEMFENEQKVLGEEYDFGKLFERILWERDWTDKVASVFGGIRNKFRTGEADTKLSLELQALIPDMGEVKRTYDEMTSGYKDFIRAVLRAKKHWQEEE